MKKQFKLKLTTIPGCVLLLACGLLAGGAILSVQKSHGAITTPTDNGNAVFVAAPGGAIAGGMVVSSYGSNGMATAGIAINGKDIGSILLETFDLNHDGKVTLAELKQVADASFTLWDTNHDGYLSADELSAGLKSLFPAPPPGVQMRAVAVVNGVPVEVIPDEMPTPDKQLTKHVMALADTSKDGLLSLQELNDWLDKSFSQWDQDGNGSLDAQELAVAFGQLAMPNLPPQ